MKTFLWFMLSLLAVLIYACGDSNNPKIGGAPSDANVEHVSDANVKHVIDTVIKPLYVRCNDSCYTRTAKGSPGSLTDYCDYRKFTQYKGNLEIKVKAETVSEADKLNGIEWAAELTVYCGDAYRECDDCTKKWQQWKQGRGHLSDGRMFTVSAIKKNGTWKYEAPALEKGITCEMIPQ